VIASRYLGLVSKFYGVYYSTLRLRILMPDGSVISPATYPFGREIFALRERDAVALSGLVTRSKFTVLVAHGRDGDWAGAVAENLGCQVVRGSSLRDGSNAAKTLVDLLKRTNGPAGIVVDGPLGPPGRAKGGVILCGKYAEMPVRAVTAEATWRVVLRRSWSKIYLPLPFSRVIFALDDPLPGVVNAGPESVDELADELSDRLELMQERAAAAIGRPGTGISNDGASRAPRGRMSSPGAR
jgi:lysophospholipid acyltransferase (LPLAT)-like uncharacterized protein